MRYAIIENNKCVNVIVAEPDFATEIGAVEIPNGFGIGDIYANDEWSKAPVPEPMPTAEERIEALEAAMLEMMEVK